MRLVTAAILVMSVASTHAVGTIDCPKSYYLRRHQQSVVISCQYDDDFHTVRWTLDGDPVVRIDNQSPSGGGLDSGDYNVLLNGSMVINMVDIKHEGRYTIEAADPGEQAKSAVIDVYVTDPVDEFTIHDCSSPSSRSELLCQGNDPDSTTGKLFCVTENSYPAVNLSWMELGRDGSLQAVNQSLVDYDATFDDTSSLYTSVSSLTYAKDSFGLQYFTCVANGRALEDGHSANNPANRSVVVEGDADIRTLPSTAKYALPGESIDVRFVCPSGDFPLGALFYTPGNGTRSRVSETLPGFGVRRCVSGRDDCQINGGVTEVKDMTVNSDGSFECVSSDGHTAQRQVTDIVTVVPPLNSTVFIEGCENTQPCSLQTNNTGSLTCYVKGAKPKVNLIFTPSEGSVTVLDESSDSLTDALTRTADTVLTITYEIDHCSGTVKMTCSPENVDVRQEIESAHVFLVTEEGSCSSTLGVVVSCVIIIAVFLALAVVVFVCKRRSKKRDDKEKLRYQPEVIPLTGNAAKLWEILFDRIKREELNEEDYQELIDDIQGQTETDPLIQLKEYVKARNFTDKVLMFMMIYFSERSANHWITPTKAIAVFVEEGKDNPDMFLPIIAEMYEHNKIDLHEYAVITECLLRERRKTAEEIFTYLKPVIKDEKNQTAAMVQLLLQYHVIGTLSQDEVLGYVDYYAMSERKIKYIFFLQSVQEHHTEGQHQEQIFELFKIIVTKATAMEGVMFGMEMNDLLQDRENMRQIFAVLLLNAYDREKIDIDSCINMLTDQLLIHQGRANKYRLAISKCCQNDWVNANTMLIVLRHGFQTSKTLVDADFLQEQIGHLVQNGRIKSEECIKELLELKKNQMVSGEVLTSIMMKNIASEKWTGDDWVTFVVTLSTQNVMKEENVVDILMAASKVHTKEVTRNSIKMKIDQAGVPRETRKRIMNLKPMTNLK